MNELIAANRNPYMGRTGRNGREKEQIAGGQFLLLHGFSLLELIADFAGQRDAVPGEDVLGKSAAVEPLRVGAAVPIGSPAKRQRRPGERVAVNSGGLRRERSRGLD